jgi:hypothetical protein
MNPLLNKEDQKIMVSYGQKDGKNPTSKPTTVVATKKKGGGCCCGK